ncbi:cytochrome P450 [Xylariaceae sp. FL0804]|nr:cytochrome P450 [Xylariaceae sp. FL0804]
MAMISLSVVVAGALVLGWLVLQLRGLGRRPADYPPGPPTVPVLGNLHQMPKEKIHLRLQEWAREYGPIYSLILGTQTQIVVSSEEVVKELLDKRGHIYSSRPELYITSKIASGGFRLTIMPYGETWRMIRRLAHAVLNVNASRSQIPYQDLEIKQMLVGLLDHPDQLFDQVHRAMGSIITQIVYGFRTHSSDNEYTRQIYENVLAISQLLFNPSAVVMESFPLMRKLPDVLLPTRRAARQLFEREKKFLTGVWMRTKRGIREGKSLPIFPRELLRVQEEEGFGDDLAAYICGVMQEAGADTSAISILGFVQAMVLHPDVQRQGQAEMDVAFPGDETMPDMEGAMAHPWIQACVKETLRWLPVVPLALPHSPVRDDVFRGYRIPKGATVILNTWTIHMDAQRYPSPRVFDPSRFFFAGDNATSSATSSLQAQADGARERDHLAFGAGRRICPGLHVAERTLALSVARLLWGFDIGRGSVVVAAAATTENEGEEEEEEKKKEEKEEEKEEMMAPLPAWDDFGDGVLAAPRPFAASFRARNPARAERMRSAWDECRRECLGDDFQWRAIPT